MKWICVITAVFASGAMGLATKAAAAPSQWEQPAAALAEQIAGILGPAQAHLTIRNNSTIPIDEIPAIRRLLTQDLKTHGVTTSEAETANLLRVTLSENLRERLWVAEIVEGNETRVAMVHADLIQTRQTPATGSLTLKSQQILTSRDAVLAILETPSGIVTLEPGQIVIYLRGPDGWQEEQEVKTGSSHTQTRDPRGALLGYASGSDFAAWLPGVECSGSNVSGSQPASWTIQCRANDDPWAITQPPLDLTDWGVADKGMNIKVAPVRAFYNTARNYFTGVLTESPGIDLPPFYALGTIPRSAGNAALLINGIDGKVQLVENGALKPVSGTRDWGSDFAALNSGCGTGTQIVASGSGEALSDSLRAYELPAQEAIPASAPLATKGTVTALWSAPNGKSIFAVVRETAGPGSADSYEVDRVTASCN